jgi:hypothetical protein
VAFTFPRCECIGVLACAACTLCSCCRRVATDLVWHLHSRDANALMFWPVLHALLVRVAAALLLALCGMCIPVMPSNVLLWRCYCVLRQLVCFCVVVVLVLRWIVAPTLRGMVGAGVLGNCYLCSPLSSSIPEASHRKEPPCLTQAPQGDKIMSEEEVMKVRLALYKPSCSNVMASKANDLKCTSGTESSCLGKGSVCMLSRRSRVFRYIQ